MVVFGIIGPCGAGKTTLLKTLPGTIRTHKEGYVQKDDETVFIDNALYLSKLRYLSAWYLEMIELKRQRQKRIVSDRCPYDVAAYVSDPSKQHSLIVEYMNEIEDSFGIKVKTIFVRVPFAVARRRVAERLVSEPWRSRYHEDDEKFLAKTWKYYEDHAALWDEVIDNNGPIEASAHQLRRIIGPR